MKIFSKYLVMGVILAFVFAGCAKQPAQEIDDTKAAIEAAAKEGGDVYAKEEVKKLNDNFAAAMDEVNTQDKKFFKKFGTAKEMFAQVKADAEALKTTIPARKEEAKNKAILLQTEARAALDEAKALLEKAPKGKGTKADIEAFKADLAGLETSFADIQAALDIEDFLGAADKAASIKEKALGISDQIKQAMEKVKK